MTTAAARRLNNIRPTVDNNTPKVTHTHISWQLDILIDGWINVLIDD